MVSCQKQIPGPVFSNTMTQLTVHKWYLQKEVDSVGYYPVSLYGLDSVYIFTGYSSKANIQFFTNIISNYGAFEASDSSAIETIQSPDELDNNYQEYRRKAWVLSSDEQYIRFATPGWDTRIILLTADSLVLKVINTNYAYTDTYDHRYWYYTK